MNPPIEFGLQDATWSNARWHDLLQSLVDNGIVTWKEVATTILGQLNPAQVGTSLASSEGFKRRYGKGKTMRIVMEWFHSQTGLCVDCETRLDLQADHADGREGFEDPLDADFIENMVLRCRRCNVIRRPSHTLGGLTHLTAEAALMWILLVLQPHTYQDYIRLCRLYGMTMADIRMEEAWAMASWLSQADPCCYHIDDDNAGPFDILQWPDGALTRRLTDARLAGDPEPIYSGVPFDHIIGIATIDPLKPRSVRFYQLLVSDLPYSSYDLGDRPRNDIAISYHAPNRQKGAPQQLLPLPPRGHTILARAIRRPDQQFRVTFTDGRGSRVAPPSDKTGYAGIAVKGASTEATFTVEAV